MKVEDQKKKELPLWAKSLGQLTFDKINSKLDEGWKTMDVVRELAIPADKVRSLQTYVQQHGPRRRLLQFARFKNALLDQIEEFGEKMIKALSMTATLAVSNKTKPAMQVRAVEAMSKFAVMLEGLMKQDDKAEEHRKRDERMEDGQIDAAQIVADVLSHYGVHDHGDG